MSDDLIRRSDAIKDLCDITNNSDMPEDWHRGVSASISAMYRVPSADRPQGEWIDIEPRLNRRRVNKYKRCSYCGFSWARPFDDNYCPNCGARMLKGADDA